MKKLIIGTAAALLLVVVGTVVLAVCFRAPANSSVQTTSPAVSDPVGSPSQADATTFPGTEPGTVPEGVDLADAPTVTGEVINLEPDSGTEYILLDPPAGS